MAKPQNNIHMHASMCGYVCGQGTARCTRYRKVGAMYRKVDTRYHKVDNNTARLVFFVLQGSLKCKDACIFFLY